MKKRIALIVLCIVTLAFVVASCCACELVDKVKSAIGMDTSKKKRPVVTSVTTLKDQENWLESEEYLFNKDCTNPMPMDDNEAFFVVVSYNNPDKLSVSSVKINGTKYDSTAFAKGSNYLQTLIRYEVEDGAPSETRSFTVQNVMYVDGASTTRMGWGENVEETVSVAVRPQYYLTLNQMNADYRAEANTRETVVAPQSIYYNEELSFHSVMTPDFTGETAANVQKAGGYVFAGWYTKPGGEGRLVKGSDRYLFWCDMTLFAHYERMYDLRIKDLDTPITYAYGDGKSTTFHACAVVVNRDFNTYEATHYPTLVIPNTVVVETITYTEQTGNFGLPVYSPTVAHTEYPVIRIDNEAFRAFNTITTVSLGKFIEEIGYSAFWKCTKITRVDFPEDSELKYIGDQAFRETEALGVDVPFSFPSKLEYIGSMAFRDSGLTNMAKEGGGGESVLRVKPTWKYLGYKAFMGTKFTQVTFEPKCWFEGQITEDEGSVIESAAGNKTIQFQKNGDVQNLIGARLFAGCIRLTRVEFLSEDGEDNGLNIIPDYCFEIRNYTKVKSDTAFLSNVFFAEGLKYIGQYAFYYQSKLGSLKFPKSLEEIDCWAFYQCENVTELEFGGEESQLKILHSSCFGNLKQLDACSVTSAVFEKYGSGVFRGCDRMKCVIFENLSEVPKGYKNGERKDAKGNDLEVIFRHVQSDFLYATGEAGEKTKVNADDPRGTDAKTYSTPLRIFCPQELVEGMQQEMKAGKEMTVGNVSSGQSAFSKSVFVHSLDLYRDYTFTDEDGKEHTVKVALQYVWKADTSSGTPNKTNTLLGYSLVYWSERSDYVKLPVIDNLNISAGGKQIIEISHYALPNSVRKVYIPECYRFISHHAFDSCSSLSDLVFENVDTLEYVGDYAFFGTALRSFVGGTNLKVIGEYAFQRCLVLRWVDLSMTPIVNKVFGNNKKRDMYKYEYELEDDELDHNNTLGYGCFKGCSSLTWIYLPFVQQIQMDTFTNCKALVTVIIPTLGKDIDTNKSATNDDAFYQYGQPTTTYDPSTIHQLKIIVDSSATEQHEEIFPRKDVIPYDVISAENTKRPE